jgi:hypothetical protein
MDKIKFIETIFNHYKKELSIVEQIAILTIWEEVCVNKEEYEMANVIKKELYKIISDSNNVLIK